MDKSAGRPGSQGVKLPQTPKLPIKIFPVSCEVGSCISTHRARPVISEVRDIFFRRSPGFYLQRLVDKRCSWIYITRQLEMQLLERRKDRMDLLLALLIPLKWVIIAYFVFIFVSKLL